MISVVALIISLVLTITMGAVFVLIAIIALNGFMSMADAMPTYLAFNCFAWPVMVGLTTLVMWLVLTLGKQKRPFPQIFLLNAGLVTAFLVLAALLLYFT